MTCAIVYSSRTGNTKQLAEAVRASLGEQTCLYICLLYTSDAADEL